MREDDVIGASDVAWYLDKLRPAGSLELKARLGSHRGRDAGVEAGARLGVGGSQEDFARRGGLQIFSFQARPMWVTCGLRGELQLHVAAMAEICAACAAQVTT